ncbi:hypothetical protein H9P43_004841 [Blastocladiella emersonii ATCC 22665]|nr:hypothetical protein H9P43_004841 [Blastocladiella emersonii ATCC 22665]
MMAQKSLTWLEWLRFHPRSITILVTATVFADMFVYAAVIPLLPEIAINQLGSTPSRVGVLVSIFAITQLVSTPLFGRVSDKFGSRKLPVVVSLIILAVTSLLYTLVTEYWHYLLVRAVQGVAAAGNLTLSFALIGDVYPTSELGVAMGIALAGMNAGGMVGPALGGLLYGKVGPTAPFWAALALAAACLVFRLLVDDEPARAYKRAQLEAKDGAIKTGGGSTSILTLIRARPVWLNACVVFVLGLLVAGLEPILPPYLTAQYDTSVTVNGLIFLAPAVPGIIVGPIAGWLCDRFSPRPVLVIGTLAFAAVAPFIGVPISLAFTVVILVATGATFTVALTPTLPSMGAYIDAHHRDAAGQVYAIFHMSFALSLSLGPIAAGALFEHWGMLACVGVFSGLAVVMAVVFAFLDSGVTEPTHQAVGDEESDEKVAVAAMSFEEFLQSRL